MKKINEEERDIPAIAFSAVCAFMGGVAFQVMVFTTRLYSLAE